MIRDAGLDDIPAIVEMGARIAVKADLAAHVGYDPASVAKTLEYLITNPDGLLFFDESGAIGGLCYPHPFNSSVKVGQEFFWFSDSAGDGLLIACEDACRDMGGRFWTMLSHETMRPKAVGRLLERRGYRALEHSYIKEL